MRGAQRGVAGSAGRGKALQHLRPGAVRAGVGRGEQVGFVAAQLLNKLRGPGLSAAVEVGPNPLPHVVRRRDDDLDEEVIEDDDVSALAATLAPHAHSVAERTRVVQALVDALVADSELLLARPDQGTEVAFVPRSKLRDELQDVRALGAPLNSPPPPTN